MQVFIPSMRYGVFEKRNASGMRAVLCLLYATLLWPGEGAATGDGPALAVARLKERILYKRAALRSMQCLLATDALRISNGISTATGENSTPGRQLGDISAATTAGNISAATTIGNISAVMTAGNISAATTIGNISAPVRIGNIRLQGTRICYI